MENNLEIMQGIFLQWFLQILVQMQLRLWRKPVNVTRLLFIIWQSGVISDDWKNMCYIYVEEEQHL